MSCAIEGDTRFPFELHEPVGRGRFGIVHRATDTRTGAEVAVKEVDATGRPELLHGFLVQSGLAHPNVLPVHEVREVEGGAWVAMPLARGANPLALAARCTREARERLVRRVVMDVSRALEHVHERGWVHRDVKPANVLLDRRRALLCDFGLAHALAESGPVPPAGTPPYMAPEALLAWRAGPELDWYGLGVTAWELLAGTLPFDAPTLQEEVLLKARGAPPLPAGVDARWGPLLEGLLDPEPSRRWTGRAARAHVRATRSAPLRPDAVELHEVVEV